MKNKITIHLNSGNFQQGFHLTIQPNNTPKFTTALPEASKIPHLYKNWQQQYISLTPTARAGFKKHQITNISSSECFHYYQALSQEINTWFTPIKTLIPHNEKTILILNTQNISHTQTAEIIHKLPWGEIYLSENQKIETILSFREGKNTPNIISEIPRQVRILGILGDNTGINISQDKELIQKLKRRGAIPKFLPQSNQELKRQDFAQLWDEAWDIIIFSGHSQTYQQHTGIIHLNSQEYLDFQEIRKTLITAKQQGLQLAIFNSCDGLGLAQQLADIGITIIIWREITPDQIAPLFLKYFLTSFTNNNSIYTSMQQARQKLQELHPEIEQKLPGVTQLPMIIHHGKVTPPTWSQLRGRSGGRVGGADWNLENLLTRQELRNRKNLLEAVKHEVVARLSQSLHNQMEVLINVPKQFQSQQVKRIWDMSVKIGDRPTLKLSPEADIIDVFDDPMVGGRLLILGAPGSGKTTTLLELGQELVIRAQMDGELGIPVFLNLSSWRDDKQSIEEWLVEELRWKYGVSRDIGRRLVKSKQLLPMLDGLDELESSRQVLCVEAINRFLLGECRPMFLVVCSRLEEYESVGGGLCLNGAVCLLPLSDVQVEGYLLGFGKHELWEWVRGDGELLELVRVPLFLSMVVVAGVSLHRWGELRGDERLDFLLDAYVCQMLERRVDSRFYGEKGMPSDERTLEWLGWLASGLEKHSMTEFLIERLRYSWVEKKLEVIIVNIFTLIFLVVSFPIQIYALFTSLYQAFITIGGLIGCLIGLIIPLLINSSRVRKFLYSIGVKRKHLKSLKSFIGMDKKTLNKDIEFYKEIEKESDFEVETLSFSWERFKSTFKTKFAELYSQMISSRIKKILLLSYILIYALIVLTSIPMIITGHYNFIYSFLGINFNLIFISCISLIEAFKGGELKTRKYPNEGMWKTAFNTGILVIIFLPISTTLLLLTPIMNLETNLLFILVACMPILIYMPFLMVVIEHLTLRITFFLTKKAPWNYARFLNYATEKMLLQRVGGGYRFIHRLLQERLAWRYNNQQK
ncbi:MAG: NACHT domain-containing protein [Cyanobacteriota bacterium]|nr:NACHT domain-containing protein [Cyanobacteriota bacterium]